MQKHTSSGFEKTGLFVTAETHALSLLLTASPKLWKTRAIGKIKTPGVPRKFALAADFFMESGLSKADRELFKTLAFCTDDDESKVRLRYNTGCSFTCQ